MVVHSSLFFLFSQLTADTILGVAIRQQLAVTFLLKGVNSLENGGGGEGQLQLCIDTQKGAILFDLVYLWTRDVCLKKVSHRNILESLATPRI